MSSKRCAISTVAFWFGKGWREVQKSIFEVWEKDNSLIKSRGDLLEQLKNAHTCRDGSIVPFSGLLELEAARVLPSYANIKFEAPASGSSTAGPSTADPSTADPSTAGPSNGDPGYGQNTAAQFNPSTETFDNLRTCATRPC